MPITKEPTLLEQLLEKRKGLVDAWSEAINARETERGKFEARMVSTDEAEIPTEEQRNAFTAAETTFKAESDQREAEIKELDTRIRDQEEIARRQKEAADASKAAGVVSNIVEPLTYRRDTQFIYSYWRDLAVSEVPGVNFADVTRQQAGERLERHSAEVTVEVPKRIEAAERRAAKRVEEALEEEAFNRNRHPGSLELRSDPFHKGALYNPHEKRVEPNRTDGFGGYFVQLVAA